ncbi:IS5 family transposase [Legionella longbeachae]|nr:IS5 family transposase [Legionella longbeachae]
MMIRGYCINKGFKSIAINWVILHCYLNNRGNIKVWLSEDAISQWYEQERIYDGSGSPKRYTDFAIITCHEIWQVYRLPLRQTQGFIISFFQIMRLNLECPDFSTLSKRLCVLNIKTPGYKKTDKTVDGVHAIDSTGLKRFGRGEWHTEKYELSRKASWRKFHAGVNQSHYIEACVLTDRFEKMISGLMPYRTI